jgi:hypothetical protein
MAGFSVSLLRSLVVESGTVQPDVQGGPGYRPPTACPPYNVETLLAHLDITRFRHEGADHHRTRATQRLDSRQTVLLPNVLRPILRTSEQFHLLLTVLFNS